MRCEGGQVGMMLRYLRWHTIQQQTEVKEEHGNGLVILAVGPHGILRGRGPYNGLVPDSMLPTYI